MKPNVYKLKMIADFISKYDLSIKYVLELMLSYLTTNVLQDIQLIESMQNSTEQLRY